MAFASGVILLFLVAVGLLIALLVVSLRKITSWLKIMLLGIHITLLGGIIAVDVNSDLGGLEYLMVLIGFIVSLYGLSKND